MAAELLAAIIPPSRVKNIQAHQAAFVEDRLSRMWLSGVKDNPTLRVKVLYQLLDSAFDQGPEPMALIADETFGRLRELQRRESSLMADAHKQHGDDLERKFATELAFFEFLHERMHRTLGAPYVTADAIARTQAPLAGLVDRDGRVTRRQVEAVEAGRGMKTGMLSEGLDHHLRNSAAHHLYSVVDDHHVRVWDVDPKTLRASWGPHEWSHWELKTRVWTLATTCSVLLLGLACFDIANGPTIRARRWGLVQSPRPQQRRDIAKAELEWPANSLGLEVESVEIADKGELVIGLRVMGETMLDQTTSILVGGARHLAFQREVRTLWSPLRAQVYGFLQATFDVHGGHDVVRVTVVGSDGKQALGHVEAPVDARRAMISGKESVEAIRARMSADTLDDEKIPVVIEGPVVPAI
ncbi:MAG TPA: hypothetical protein VFD85_15360 [Gemmatimonadales bacterium]|nr:hypothetical protein [Gemmatimonadales bacterium]